MSCTEIYGLTKNSTIFIGETRRNSWWGAMAVWQILEKKYLPKFIPEWVKTSGKMSFVNKDLNKEYSRCASIDKKDMEEIWKLYNSKKITKTDKIVLGSTFDHALAEVKDINKILIAFREFEGETSLKEQADIIEKAIKENQKIIAIGWNQTSVNGDTWLTENYDEATDTYNGYNIEKDEKHWFINNEA